MFLQAEPCYISDSLNFICVDLTVQFTLFRPVVGQQKGLKAHSHPSPATRAQHPRPSMSRWPRVPSGIFS